MNVNIRIKTYNHINENCRYDFLYTTNTYSGFFASYVERLKQEENNIIERFKCFFIDNLNYKNNTPIVIFKSYENSGILKTRICMAELISDDCKEIGVIWFDDGKIDIIESLKEIFHKIDWKEAKEFDY
jgi:hypothetical protein